VIHGQGFQFCLKDAEGEKGVFIGSEVLEKGEETYTLELAYLFISPHWGNGYGTEAASAMANEYAQWMISDQEDGFMKLMERQMPLHIQILNHIQGITHIEATASCDNPASWKILDALGFSCSKPDLPVMDHEYAKSCQTKMEKAVREIDQRIKKEREKLENWKAKGLPTAEMIYEKELEVCRIEKEIEKDVEDHYPSSVSAFNQVQVLPEVGAYFKLNGKRIERKPETKKVRTTRIKFGVEKLDFIRPMVPGSSGMTQ